METFPSGAFRVSSLLVFAAAAGTLLLLLLTGCCSPGDLSAAEHLIVELVVAPFQVLVEVELRGEGERTLWAAESLGLGLRRPQTGSWGRLRALS